MFRHVCLLTLFASLGACASATGAGGAPNAGTGRPDQVLWVDGRSGELVSDAAARRRMFAARVVLVGERHADPRSMATHGAVLALLASEAKRSAVAVEWLPHSARLAVSGWLASGEPVEALGEAVAWGRVWGHELAAYAPVLEAMRRLGFAMVPVNAEPGLARLVARHGVNGVPPERVAELPPLDSANAAQRAWFSGVMEQLGAAGHGHGHGHGQGDKEGVLERLYLAQLVWDESMARRVVALTNDFARVVVFAGTGHIGSGFGIPERLGALGKLVVLPAESLAEARSRALEAPLSDGAGEAGARYREADLFAVVENGGEGELAQSP